MQIDNDIIITCLESSQPEITLFSKELANNYNNIFKKIKTFAS